MFLFHCIEKTAVPTDNHYAFTASPVCVRSFSLPKGIIDVITQYIHINALKNVFHYFITVN